MNEQEIALSIGGTLIAIGVCLVQASRRRALPGFLYVWWVDANDPLREVMSRSIAQLVGAGFILMGLVLILVGVGA